MKVLFDTSVLITSMLEDHVAHVIIIKVKSVQQTITISLINLLRGGIIAKISWVSPFEKVSNTLSISVAQPNLQAIALRAQSMTGQQ